MEDQRIGALISGKSGDVPSPLPLDWLWDHLDISPRATGADSQGANLQRRDSDCSSPSSVEVINVWSYSSTPKLVLILVSTANTISYFICEN